MSPTKNKIVILPNELLAQILFLIPLNGLINCSKSNGTLSTLGIERARKVQKKVGNKLKIVKIIWNILPKSLFGKCF
jgi:hypothetical protein